MRLFIKFILFIFVRLVGPKGTKSIISTLAKFAGLDLLVLSYNEVGILKPENEEVSGEHFLINKILKNNLMNIAKPIIFDVGANVGKYSMMLVNDFPHAQIYSFEPNKNAFTQLVAKVGSSVNCVNAGMGDEEKAKKLFTYANSLASSHASIYEDIFRTLYKADVTELDFQMTTLDLFCEREDVTGIDFLKIDTEGNELNVLKGGQKMLAAKKIKIIQFEFGECDVFSRVFLRDFYLMLSDYNIYRLDSHRLIPLFEYDSTKEIFRYQNFIAVRKDYPFLDK
jgi:FkbM family methyltransferase